MGQRKRASFVLRVPNHEGEVRYKRWEESPPKNKNAGAEAVAGKWIPKGCLGGELV